MQKRLFGLVAAVGLILAACDGGGGTDESPAASPGGPGESPAATGDAGEGRADSIVMVVDGQITNLSNAAADVPTAEAIGFIYNGLYQYNAEIQPVPDLTDGPCETSEDGLEWTCTLREGLTFHNGDPVTADDVVYTYQIAASPNCRFNPSICLEPFLASVEATDERTVVFNVGQKDENGELIAAYAPFETVALPGIGIESRAVIEGQFEEFIGATEAITPEQVGEAISAITPDDPETPEAEGTAGEDCGGEAALTAAEELLATAGAAGLPLREDYNIADPDPEQEGEAGEGEFDPCAYAQALTPFLLDLQTSLEAEGIDAVAAAYPLLPFNREPVGTGPWMCEPGCLRAGESLTLVAHEGYHEGPPETATINMPIITDDLAGAEAVGAGQADWKYSLTADSYAALQDNPDVQFAEYPDFGYFALMYNLREGSLFAELEVRQAVQLCIDKAATVEAATSGQGVPIEADIPPASWAYNPDIQPVERDVEAATALLEGAGWVDTDGDGVREKGGQPLSTTVLVRAGRPDRIAFMELLRDQVIECGIQVNVEPADFATVLLPSLEWPHIPPGKDRPWDAYFGGWGTSYDPDPYSIWHCDQRTSEEQPDTYNYIGFCDERVDEIIEEGLASTDIEERRELYFEFQEILAEQQPYLFAWSDIAREAIDANMTTSGEELQLDSPVWAWQLEKLYITEQQ